MPEILLVTLFSYLMGSIPFGLILSKLFGYGDLRKSGSGNIGATNAMRVGGKKLGILTLILDAVKGVIPLIILKQLRYSHELLAISGTMSVFGHIFPIWLKFKGGKGVTTTVAVILTLIPYAGLVLIFVWLSVFKITRTVSLASLLAIFVSAIVSFWLETPYFYMSIALFSLIVWRHKDNIKRMKEGKELSFKR